MAILFFRCRYRPLKAESILPFIVSRSRFLRKFIRLLNVCLVAAVFFQPINLVASQSVGAFRWAGDPEGGAPFVEADPLRPDQLVGFDVEIAELIARKLNRESRFINTTSPPMDKSRGRAERKFVRGAAKERPPAPAAMA